MNGRRFVAIDGEGWTVGDEHRYVLLASSTGDYRYSPEGLSTAECFNFLLSERAKAKRYIFIAFGLNYDVNMMLRDIGKEKLRKLWKTKALTWYGFRLEWIPGKWFSVSKGKDCRIRIYDVFGFFQKSFVNSLKSWNLNIQDDLEQMKQSRSTFNESDRDQIIEYCLGECKSLVSLMESLNKALRAVNLVPSSWVGAGSIAASILRKEQVREAHAFDSDYSPEIGSAILHAYFGGRVELFQLGQFERLVDYDIRSAYPFQALSLPTLEGGHWKHSRKYEPTEQYGLWRVSWNTSISRISPFPVRRSRNIFYPSSGSGWYHASEVKRAVELFGEQIHIHEGFTFTPVDSNRPFDFVREGFRKRAELKERGHAGEKVLKLGLNAIYGKLAQGHGYKGKLPPFQSYFWAGYITAGTRARLLDVAAQAPDALVMVATDGIFFDSHNAPDIACDSVLGSFERSEIENAFVAQPGVYSGLVDGELVKRSRGFFAREIDFDSLRAGYEKVGVNFSAEYSSTRFVGLGAALSRGDLSVWRKWHTSDRRLSLYPNRKFVLEDSFPEPTRLAPPSMPGFFSERYVPKDGDLEWAQDLQDFLDGMDQPMREFD